jgi:hypothetical protein
MVGVFLACHVLNLCCLKLIRQLKSTDKSPGAQRYSANMLSRGLQTVVMLPIYLHLAVNLLYDKHGFDANLLHTMQIKTLVYLVPDCYDITQRGLGYSHIPTWCIYIRHVVSTAAALAAVEWLGMEPGLCILANIGTWHRVLYIIFGVMDKVNRPRRHFLLIIAAVWWGLSLTVPIVFMVIYISSNYNLLLGWWVGIYISCMLCFIGCDIPLLWYIKKQHNLSSSPTARF